ncbi:heavy metal translocating P-type ATPase [Helicobacter himalayensis]|uniref:heavy metal translocating P-type ATPase n=1 Tax=Helicobacter himalayensis TaxID=1591088 RepID=UPI000834A00D|nr:heavy metal translocating P-type ATPase [Helicobacter himalayensis]
MQTFFIKNLDCASCAAKIEKELKNAPGVREVKLSFALNTLQIDCDDIESIKALIARLEPDVTLSAKKEKTYFFNKQFFLLLVLVTLFLVSLWVFHYIEGAQNYEIFFRIFWVGIYLISGRNVFFGTLRSFKKKEFFDENVLMLSASIAAFCIGEWEEAVSIMLFFSAGEYLQDVSVKKSKDTINAATLDQTTIAHKIDGEQTIDIDPKELKVGDEIVLYAGEMLPCDSTLLESSASFNCAAISGESLPCDFSKDSEVLSGSIALGSAIRLRILRPFEKSQIAKITELITNASSQKSYTENFITTFARYYTPIVLALAVLIAIIPPLVFEKSFEECIHRALVVLMVSCPCALVVSVPIGYFGGLSAASKNGALLKGSNYLEALSKLSLIAFDKTGTLTKGVFKVIDIIPAQGYSKNDVLHYALCAHNLSNHPIAQSIKSVYEELSHTHHMSEYEELSGLGVRAVCDSHEIIAGNDKILHKFNILHNTCHVEGSVIHISVDKNYLGYILIADELKNDAIEALCELKNMGIECVMLSGDGEYPCEMAARKLGCEYYHSLLPQDKSRIFSELKARAQSKGKVAFVGDGINDAPTLALADVGIAMGGGSDISHQNADVILLNDSLNTLLKSIKIAKKTKIIIYQNIIFALALKGVFIVLGLFGLANIWEAVFADVGVALIALANAMRCLRL